MVQITITIEDNSADGTTLIEASAKSLNPTKSEKQTGTLIRTAFQKLFGQLVVVNPDAAKSN